MQQWLMIQHYKHIILLLLVCWTIACYVCGFNDAQTKFNWWTIFALSPWTKVSQQNIFKDPLKIDLKTWITESYTQFIKSPELKYERVYSKLHNILLSQILPCSVLFHTCNVYHVYRINSGYTMRYCLSTAQTMKKIYWESLAKKFNRIRTSEEKKSDT